MLNMKLIKLGAGAIIGFIIAIYLMSGMTHVNPGEVGLLIKNVGANKGMQKDVLSTGTSWVEPFTYDVTTYDARCRQMQDKPEVMRAGTADGQPVLVDFTVQLCLIPSNVPTLHSTMGPTYYDSNVHPAIQSIIKNSVPSEPSDLIYTAGGRTRVEKLMNDKVAERFAASGINATINLRDVRFENQDYIKILERKATAAQALEVNTRMAAAAVQEAVRVANEAEGEKQKRIKAAEAAREESRLEGEGSRLKQEETAKGNLAIAQAEAAGVKLRREALSGAGGAELVSIEWARQMGPNIKVYGFPTGAPGTNTVMPIGDIFKGAFEGAKK